ncbi:MAG: hypothetical protein HY231_11835 [Acidobacteria bacterium]|nr:hypothetical protein [Acidobacteriota bacterium]
MSMHSAALQLRINPAQDFSPLSSLLKLLSVIFAPSIFLAISGRAPNRVSWYFLSVILPFFLLSLLIGLYRFTRESRTSKELSIS